MFDDRSFSAKSFDQRSWWGVLVDLVNKFRRQLFVFFTKTDVTVRDKNTDITVKQRV